MVRYIVLFFVLLALSIALMAALLAYNGLDLFSAPMAPMLLVCVLVAGYVSFRIATIVSRRKGGLDRTARPGGAGKSKLSGIFNQKSAAQAAREARVAAKRKQLVAEGKLDAEEIAETRPAEEPENPTRVSQSAPIKDRMAARAERVRRAKEQGKL